MSKKWSRLIFYINKFYLFNRKNYIYAMLYPLLVIPLFYGLMIYHFVHLFMPAEKWRKKTKKDREYDDSTWTDNFASSDWRLHTHFECITHFRMDFTHRLLFITMLLENCSKPSFHPQGKWPKFSKNILKYPYHILIWEMVFASDNHINRFFGNNFWNRTSFFVSS